MSRKVNATKVGLSAVVLALGISVFPTGSILENTPLGSQIGVQVAEASSKQTYTTTANLRMRSGDSTKHKIIKTVNKGQKVEYIKKKGKWFEVKHGKNTGWMHSDYLKKDSAPKAQAKKAEPKKAEPKKQNAPKASGKQTYTTTSNLNMRSGNSTKHKIITMVKKGQKVEYIKKSGNWFQVKYGKHTGWMSSSYLKKDSAPKAQPAKKAEPKKQEPKKAEPKKKDTPKASSSTKYYTTSDLNMRKGAGTNHARITTIPKGKEITYVKKSGNWFQVKYGKNTGWVSSSYVTKNAPKAPAKNTASKNNNAIPKYNAPGTNTPGKYVSGILVVNKKNGLPSNYNPGENKTARQAIDRMVKDAKKEGITLNAFSNFRTYSRQQTLYNNYVKSHGQKQADRFSAKPGYSEHQTGLAFDVGGADSKKWAENSFAGTKEAKWLEKNSHKYGFIIRYPKGKENITGYQYEPWHLRFLGTDNAKKVKDSGKTLEEYLGIKG